MHIDRTDGLKLGSFLAWVVLLPKAHKNHCVQHKNIQLAKPKKEWFNELMDATHRAGRK